ncbi:MAG TPA: thermonuclease family protein [Stellaceae bacterium]|nr:thermonuclease family protein [Stellaceae bacterium]
MRIRTIVVVIFAAFALAWGIGRAILGNPSTVDRYVVIDGDTFALLPKSCIYTAIDLGCPAQRLRLAGADAFESKQTCRDANDVEWPCGKAATDRLRELVKRPDFSCRIDPEFVDRHAREFSICYTGGRDVAAILVREGLAFSYGRDDQYLPLENEAKEARRGAWAGRFVRPQYFRQGARG